MKLKHQPKSLKDFERIICAYNEQGYCVDRSLGVYLRSRGYEINDPDAEQNKFKFWNPKNKAFEIKKFIERIADNRGKIVVGSN